MTRRPVLYGFRSHVEALDALHADAKTMGAMGFAFVFYRSQLLLVDATGRHHFYRRIAFVHDVGDALLGNTWAAVVLHHGVFVSQHRCDILNAVHHHLSASPYAKIFYHIP